MRFSNKNVAKSIKMSIYGLCFGKDKPVILQPFRYELYSHGTKVLSELRNAAHR